MLRRNLRTAARVIVASTRALAFSCIALGFTAPASAGTNQFTLVGPDSGWILQVQFHPDNPSIVYALTTGGYYRSTDAGLNWSPVGQNLNLQFTPLDLAIDPSDHNRVLVAVPGQTPLVSTDAGATLAHGGNFPFLPADVRHIEFSAGSVVYAASGVRIVRSTDSGRTWTEKTAVTANPANVLQWLRVDPIDSNVLYVDVLGVGGFRSTDGGGSWQPMPALPANTSDMAITATTPRRIWVASFDTGLHLSTDGGATFPGVFPGGPAPASVITIALDPQNQSVVYVSLGEHGVFRTADGNGWANVTGNARIGLVTSIAVNPVDSTHVMLGGQAGIAIGVPATLGVGGTWERRDRGIRATTANDMSFASGSGRIYIGTTNSGVHFLAANATETTPVDNQALFELLQFPAESTGFGLLAQSRGSDRLFFGIRGGYARSDDGGETWQLGTTGSNNTVLHFADSPANPDLIVASGAPGMHRSTDGGDTWLPATTGLPAQPQATALVFSSAAPNTVFAGIQVYAGGPHGVYKSTDGGASWSPANAGFETSEIRGLAVHPTDPQIVYAAANANGLLKSTTGGASWTRIVWPDFPGNTFAVALDPERPNIVYAGGWNVIGRSVDGGATWQELRASAERPEWQVNALLVDPRRTSSLLASTFSQGVVEMTIAPNLVLESGAAFVNPVAPGAQETYRYRLRNTGPFDATGARAVVTLPADATGISATTTNGACVVQGTTVTCTAPTLTVTGAADIEVRSTHPAVGTIEVLASASGDQPDPEPANNGVRYTVTVAQPPPSPPPPPPTPPSNSGGGGGGGGGTSSWLWLLALAALRIARSYTRPRRLSTSGVGPSNVAIATLPTYFRSRTPTGVV